MPDWRGDHKFRVNGGRRLSSTGPAMWTLEIDDYTSGTFMMKIELNGDQLLQILSGAYLSEPVSGSLACEEWRDTWGKYRWSERLPVPLEVVQGLYGDAAKEAAAEWFEGLAVSSQWDNYRIAATSSPAAWRVEVWRWVDSATNEALKAAIEESMTEDDDEDGDDDDE